MASITLPWIQLAAIVGALQGVLLTGVLVSQRKNRTANRLLAAHPVTDGRSEAERVERVVTFTGQSVKGPEGSVLFLRHGSTALLREPHPRVEKSGGDVKVLVEYGEEKPASGWGQGLALLHGRGRVVVLGEAAVLSAQLDGKRKVGMNLNGNDDRKLALNILHWLSGILPAK